MRSVNLRTAANGLKLIGGFSNMNAKEDFAG